MFYSDKYVKAPQVNLPDRTWPNQEITHAPIWCSVDLRDGNQALTEPMTVDEKIEFFQLLVKLGFKEIEVGFPSASQIEYDFVRQLIERRLIPDDVTIQVLVQCREHLVEKTLQSIQGAKRVIVHIYNPTSTLQRDVVFHMERQEIKHMALLAAEQVKEFRNKFPGKLILEYSPESFTGTELDFALEVCTEILSVWGATSEDKVIINLPATVEMSTPNVYADQIEWMRRNLLHPETYILSIHTHNDRGTGAAATELGLLAGAQRVEGTLFGNGERTGNADILTIAYNMFSQGIDPMLDLHNIYEISEVYERCCKLPVDARHPYAGKYVFTAFSGSHQDAINKGIRAMRERGSKIWAVPYLTIDPADIGRSYEPIVRINSQSGKGGVAFIMDTYYGYKLPRGMYKEFAKIIQGIAEQQQGEVAPEGIMEAFREHYLQKKYPYHFLKLRTEERHIGENDVETYVEIIYECKNEERRMEAWGNGPLDAALQGMREDVGKNLKILDFSEHALGLGSKAQAAAYIHMLDSDSGETTFGVGVSSNITRASIRAMFSAVNRLT